MEECKPILNTGLRGFKVATTRISDVDGLAGKLIYRGYLIKELAGKISYEEVVYLLLYEKLPNKKELDHFKKQLAEERQLPPEFILSLENRPKDALPMDILQAGAAMLAHHEYESPRNFELDFFSISREEVSEELREVFEEFGYDAPENAHYLEAAE